MLYQTLAGVRPFDGESVHDTMTRILTARVPPLPAELPALPAELHVLLERSLAKDPAQRFAGVRAQLEAALAIPSASPSPRAQDRRQLHARAIRPYPAAALDAEAQGREEALPLESLLTLGRPTTGAVPRTRWPVAATLAGLALAVLAVAWWARGRDPQAVPPSVSKVLQRPAAPTETSAATQPGTAAAPPPRPVAPVTTAPADKGDATRAASANVERPRPADGAPPPREARTVRSGSAASLRPDPEARSPSPARGANDTPILDD